VAPHLALVAQTFDLALTPRTHLSGFIFLVRIGDDLMDRRLLDLDQWRAGVGESV